MTLTWGWVGLKAGSRVEVMRMLILGWGWDEVLFQVETEGLRMSWD